MKPRMKQYFDDVLDHLRKVEALAYKIKDVPLSELFAGGGGEKSTKERSEIYEALSFQRAQIQQMETQVLDGTAFRLYQEMGMRSHAGDRLYVALLPKGSTQPSFDALAGADGPWKHGPSGESLKFARNACKHRNENLNRPSGRHHSQADTHEWVVVCYSYEDDKWVILP